MYIAQNDSAKKHRAVEKNAKAIAQVAAKINNGRDGEVLYAQASDEPVPYGDTVKYENRSDVYFRFRVFSQDKVPGQFDQSYGNLTDAGFVLQDQGKADLPMPVASTLGFKWDINYVHSFQDVATVLFSPSATYSQFIGNLGDAKTFLVPGIGGRIFYYQAPSYINPVIRGGDFSLALRFKTPNDEVNIGGGFTQGSKSYDLQTYKQFQEYKVWVSGKHHVGNVDLEWSTTWKQSIDPPSTYYAVKVTTSNGATPVNEKILVHPDCSFIADFGAKFSIGSVKLAAKLGLLYRSYPVSGQEYFLFPIGSLGLTAGAFNLKAGFDINPLAVSSKVGPVKRAFFNLGYAFYETPQVSVSAVLNTEYNIFPADGPKAIELMPGFSIFFGGGK